jgi:hypothetical protein
MIDPVPLITGSDATVPVTVQARTGLAPMVAFDLVVPIDLSLIFKAWGPFPGVRGVRNQTGPWDHVGPSRNPELTDGSTASETLTEYTPGHSFAYELTGFTNVLGRLVHGVRGEWTFTPDGNGTLIRWTYEFKPRAPYAGVVRRGLSPLWRRYMRRAMDRTVVVVERMRREQG